MKRIILLITFVTFIVFAEAQNYKPVSTGSKVHFTIKNFGIGTGGELSGLGGSIYFEPANAAAASFSVTAEVKTIDTDSENRDEHLRGEDYFDAEKYPQIIIKSTKITVGNKSGATGFNFTGSLTMHGITKEISFPFTATPQGNDYLFAGEFELDRLDYGVGETSAVLSKTVKVSLSILARKS